MAKSKQRAVEAVPGRVPTIPTMDVADDTPLSFDTPESSSITMARYDPEALRMVIYFKDGHRYSYDGVEPIVWREFAQASSKGTYFAKHIRPLFPGRRV